MSRVIHWLRRGLVWLMPVGLYRLRAEIWPEYLARRTYLKRPLQLASENRVLKDRHRSQRCFIIANGPSVNTQNLLPLKNELVFSVSNGYHHKNYLQIQPKYHCVPQLTYGKVTTSDAIAWFKEMHEKLGDAELFLNYTEEQLVREHDLFPGRRIHYLCLHDSFERHSQDSLIDITGTIPGVQSVPIMCLMVAMYMGCREIYLLGTEHDQFKTGRYGYFYKPTVLNGKDIGVASDGKVIDSNYEVFTAMLELWRQYRYLKQIAHQNEISIYNATHGGELDEFPRVQLEQIISLA